MQQLEVLIGRVERWIESIDREVDRLGRDLARLNSETSPSEIECGFINARLAYLANERKKSKKRLEQLRGSRRWEELMFARRPLPAQPRKRKGVA